VTIATVALVSPPGADELLFDLYRRIPDTRITDIMLDVDREIGFTEASRISGPVLRRRTGSA
jgi:hypothetical protein